MSNAMKRYPLATNAESSKKFEDLFLFGYQSNIFNDDEKALYVDQGKHLIPWMGDESLMIDRYDGRGHLSDLNPFDADLTKGRWEPLNDREKQIEAMLDEERFYELNNDIHEKMLYEEEELKRLNEALADNSYSAVAFNYYDEQNFEEKSTDAEEKVGYEKEEDDNDDAFVMPKNLNIAFDIPLPTSARQYSIIERTAMFVSKQGSQMEIIIKTKQKDNPSFHFLDFTSPLYLFYKQLVELIKSGKFVPIKKVVEVNSENQLEQSHDSHHEDQISSIDFLQSIQDKLPGGQIANTPYAKLLSNLVKLAPTTLYPATTATAIPVLAEKGLASEDEEDASNVAAPPPPPPPPPLNDDDLNSSDEDNQQENESITKEISSKPEIIPPPPDQQPIIDKMAEYVIRNGPEFEELVKMKKDKRFAFLEDHHQFRSYYVYKKQIYLENKKNEENIIPAEPERIGISDPIKTEETLTLSEAKPLKLVDYEFTESSQLLVSYNGDSDESDYEDEGVKTEAKNTHDKKIVITGGLVHYDDDDDDGGDYKDETKLENTAKPLKDAKLNEDKKPIKSLVSNYDLYSDEENSVKNIKKRKRHKRQRNKVFGPMLPNEVDDECVKPKKQKYYGPNLPDNVREYKLDSLNLTDQVKGNIYFNKSPDNKEFEIDDEDTVRTDYYNVSETKVSSHTNLLDNQLDESNDLKDVLNNTTYTTHSPEHIQPQLLESEILTSNNITEDQNNYDKNMKLERKKEKSTDCDSALIPLLCVHG